MRLWHYKLFPYLPEAQFKGQLRELVAILHDWRDKGQTNHILINKVMEYPKSHLYLYFLDYHTTSCIRFGTKRSAYVDKFKKFARVSDARFLYDEPFPGWHNKEYLRVCMANLYEKHVFGRGKSRITDAEWDWLLWGYKVITGEEYQI